MSKSGGILANAVVIKSVDPDIDAEAVRLIYKSSGKWTPPIYQYRNYVIAFDAGFGEISNKIVTRLFIQKFENRDEKLQEIIDRLISF